VCFSDVRDESGQSSASATGLLCCCMREEKEHKRRGGERVRERERVSPRHHLSRPFKELSSGGLRESWPTFPSELPSSVSSPPGILEHRASTDVHTHTHNMDITHFKNIPRILFQHGLTILLRRRRPTKTQRQRHRRGRSFVACTCGRTGPQVVTYTYPVVKVTLHHLGDILIRVQAQANTGREMRGC